MSWEMFLDIHIIQSVPPSNINRDDTGSPKTAVFGGTRRARVSSQAWKRATRKRFNRTLSKAEIGYRSRLLASMLGGRLQSRIDDISEEKANALASDMFAAAGIKMTSPKVAQNAAKKPDESGYLLFLSAGQLDSLADYAIEIHTSGESIDKKRVKSLVNSENSIDVALFGRMVAEDAELNIDAAVQVAHAISVQAVEQEFDYFTAVDDFQEERQETGAGMIGTVEFNSSTLYRYATVNVPALFKNLGDKEATAKAATAFVESFVLSMPTGKINTFANNTVPEAVLICVRSDQPINLVGAFEDAVFPTAEEGAVALAATALVQRESEIGETYGAPQQRLHLAVGKAAAPMSVLGVGVSMKDLVSQVHSTVAEQCGVLA